jgi:hypothetical protein
MNLRERAEIERQGAKAAVRGAASHSNPFLERCNMPAATGDAPRDWSMRHDAWQRGFEVQATARRFTRRRPSPA